MNEIRELDITYKTIQNSDTSNNQNKKYLIKGVDDQGIVNKISEFFSNENMNITEVETFIEQAPITGSPLFNMKITVDCKNAINTDELNQKISINIKINI